MYVRSYQGIAIDNALVFAVVHLLGGVAFLQENLWVGSILVIIITYLIIGISIYRSSMHSGNIEETCAKNIRNDMYDHLQKLPFSYHKRKDNGDLIQCSTSDIETIRRFIAN